MIYECYKPTRQMLAMKPSELKAFLAEGDDLASLTIPIEATSIDEIGTVYKVSPQELERVEKALKRQGIYVSQQFIIRSVNRRAW